MLSNVGLICMCCQKKLIFPLAHYLAFWRTDNLFFEKLPCSQTLVADTSCTWGGFCGWCVNVASSATLLLAAVGNLASLFPTQAVRADGFIQFVAVLEGQATTRVARFVSVPKSCCSLILHSIASQVYNSPGFVLQASTIPTINSNVWLGLYKKPRTVLPYIFLLQQSQLQNHTRVYRALSPAYWWLLRCSCSSLCFSNTSSNLGNFLISRV